MVEGNGLENRRAGNGSESSNLSLSAKMIFIFNNRGAPSLNFYRSSRRSLFYRGKKVRIPLDQNLNQFRQRVLRAVDIEFCQARLNRPSVSVRSARLARLSQSCLRTSASLIDHMVASFFSTSLTLPGLRGRGPCRSPLGWSVSGSTSSFGI